MRFEVNQVQLNPDKRRYSTEVNDKNVLYISQASLSPRRTEGENPRASDVKTFQDVVTNHKNLKSYKWSEYRNKWVVKKFRKICQYIHLYL